MARGLWKVSRARAACVRQTNRGFAAGVNAGLAADDAPCVLLLNPDAWAQPTWARRMVETLWASPRAGMAACRVLGRDGRLDSAGLAVSRGGMGILRGHRHDARVSVARLDAMPLLGPTGAAAAYRREALNAIGGFPEDYFLYYEDLEVAWRLRARGYECAWLDEALVVARSRLRRGRGQARAPVAVAPVVPGAQLLAGGGATHAWRCDAGGSWARSPG